MNPFENQLLCDDASTAQFLFDLENEKLLSVNPRAAEVSQFSVEELLRKNLSEIFFSEPIDAWTRFVAALRGHESLPLQAGFFIAVRGSAEPISVYLSATRLPSRNKKKDRLLALVSAKDSRHVEAQSLFNQVFNNLSQSLYVKDKDLHFVAVNRAFCAEIGRSPDEIIGQDDFALFPRPVAEKQDADEHRVLDEGRCFDCEEQTEIGGRAHTLHVIKSPVYNPNGDIEGVLAMRWDVTTQNRRHEVQLQKKKSAAVSRLAGGIAHHFNNLLTIIRGNISLARSRLVDGDEKKINEMLEQAESATHRGAELVRNLLAHARRLPSDFTSVDVNEIIGETTLSLAGMSNVTISTNLAADAWTIRADAEQLRQLVMCLCVNALEAMKNGGQLSISTTNVHLTEDQLIVERGSGTNGQTHTPPSDCRPGEFVHLRFKDTGCGIPLDIQPHIFEPFFTTKPLGKGVGLSLAVVYGLVEQHQGWIEFESEPGQGTTFDVFFPRHVETPAAEEADSLETLHGTETILMIDNHQASVAKGVALLQRMGYQVVTLKSGESALEFIEANTSTLDLVLLDFTLPLMTGQKTLHELRDQYPDLPVVLTAADPIGPALLAKQRYRTGGFVHKPYHVLELAQVVRHALDHSKRRLEQKV